MDFTGRDAAGKAFREAGIVDAWDRTTTLGFEGSRYVVEEQSLTGDAKRPRRYRAREADLGHLVRGVRACDSEDDPGK